MGLVSALAIAGRSLEVFTAGLEVASNNIANANTPGYIREKLNVEPSISGKRGGLIMGGGVVIDGIRQEIDKFLETRIHTASADLAGASERETIFKRLEAIIGELGDSDLSTGLNDLLARMNDVANQSELDAVVQIAIQEGVQFAGEIREMRARLNESRSALGTQLTDLVNEANTLIDEIAVLNVRITEVEAGGLLGSDAGGMRSQRYAAMNRLSEIIPIRAIERETGFFDIFVGPDHLVLQGEVQHLTTQVASDRGAQVLNVRIEESAESFHGTAGELNGVIYGRDNIVGGFIDQLDIFTQNLIAEFNRIHASGQGKEGFETVTGAYAVTSTTNSLDDAGLTFAPQHGSFELQVVNKLTGLKKTTRITIDLDGLNPGPNTTLDSLRGQLDGVSNLTATITTDGRLSLAADSNFEIRFADDTSGVLSGLGINTFFTGTSSQDIGVNSVVRNDSHLFAVGNGGGPGDGSNAVKLAQFVENPIAALGDLNLDDFYNNTISGVAQNSASESAIKNGFASYRQSLMTQKQQFSGVSLDEEAINIIEFQRAFQLAARFISTIDELFATLVSI